MGALFQNVCYPTQEAARAQACSSFDVKTMNTSVLYTSECVSTVYTGLTMNICKRTNGAACVTTNQAWPVTPACDHDGGVTLSYDYFLVSLTLLCIVWGGKKLIQLFDSPHNES